LFYNTGISTYFWILTNRKPQDRHGKIVLVDARNDFTKMRKSLGEKRKTMTDEQIAGITRLYSEALEHAGTDKRVKIFDREAFGFQRITVEQPLRRIWRFIENNTNTDFTDETEAKDWITQHHSDADAKAAKVLLKEAAGTDSEAPVVTDKKGNPAPDPDLRDQENIPLPAGYLDLDEKQKEKGLIQQADIYLESDIKPYAPEAWIDHEKTKTGYEIPFTRHFYEYVPPRPLEEIDAELIETEKKIQELLAGLLR
jgi:type I restriction enzyme M protein